MVVILFVAGMFGSTTEYVLRKCNDPSMHSDIVFDGSMHKFSKWAHPGSLQSINKMLKDGIRTNGWITTPIYPTLDAHLPEILSELSKYTSTADKQILVYADSVRAAELNMLFQYYKVATGMLNYGLDVFFQSGKHNIVHWNASYTHWSQMQNWELREWFSLYYREWVSEWINSFNQVDQNFLKIKNIEFLDNPLGTFKKIINYCGLTDFDGLEEFVKEWRGKQQYIVDEFNLLDNIIDNTINNIPLQWNSLNIIAEAIIQQRLRALGYAIRCDGLNTFPTDSETLYKLLEKV